MTYHIEIEEIFTELYSITVLVQLSLEESSRELFDLLRFSCTCIALGACQSGYTLILQKKPHLYPYSQCYQSFHMHFKIFYFYIILTVLLIKYWRCWLTKGKASWFCYILNTSNSSLWLLIGRGEDEGALLAAWISCYFFTSSSSPSL